MKKSIRTYYVSMLNGKSDLKVFSGTADPLTSRESEILKLLVHGLKRPKIAETLSISTDTVNTHMKHIHSKLTAHSDVELIAKALKEGMV